MIYKFANDKNVKKVFLWLGSGRWGLLLGLVALVFVVNVNAQSTHDKLIAQGKRIYMEGVLPSGKLLQGKRAGAVQIEGQTAACETCHRRSGMGSLEGNIVVPPITGQFLFATDENRPLALVDARAPKNVTKPHSPYNLKSLGIAIRKGINVSGRKMNPLMPNYDLSNSDIKALTAYLGQLSSVLSPGVGEDTLHFATIITPDVSPKERDAMVAMMQAAFKQRNATQESYSGRMRMPLDLIPRKLRNWQLAVWDLKGTSETWAAQLTEKYRKEPVFAVISGLSKSTWEPVHVFCQQQQLPCLLPSVALSPQETAFYPLYYSRGVALEADVLANYLRNLGIKAPQRLIQIFRDDEVGRGASQALTDAMKDSAVKLENRVLGGTEANNLAEGLKGLSSADTVMLWLRPDDLAAVSKTLSSQAPTTYVSGYLAEEKFDFIPKAWMPHVKVVYPYELGEKRQKNGVMLKSWLKTWNLASINEAFQSEILFNLLFLTDLTSQMLDNFYRDYMIERAEDMLSLGSNVSVYPHLSLSRGQRFASKGSYIAHFDLNGNLIAEPDWIVP